MKIILKDGRIIHADTITFTQYYLVYECDKNKSSELLEDVQMIMDGQIYDNLHCTL